MMDIAIAEDQWPGDRDVERAFESLHEAITDMMMMWTGSEVAGARLDYASSDMLHHVCMAIPWLTAHEEAPEVERVLAREAYVSVLSVMAVTASIVRDESVNLDEVRRAASELLDRLSPYVGRSDVALRAAVVDGASLEDTIEAIDGFALDERAAAANALSRCGDESASSC